MQRDCSYPGYPTPHGYSQPASPLSYGPTLEMHQQTTNLLAKAGEIMTSVLNLGQSPIAYQTPAGYVRPVASPFTFNFDFSDRSWNLFGGNKTEIHHHHHAVDRRTEKEKEKEKENRNRLVIGVVSGIAGCVLMFFLGKAYAQSEDIQDDILSYSHLKSQWNNNKRYYHSDYAAILDRVTFHVDRIMQRRESHKTHTIALLVFGLIAAGLGLAGAIFNTEEAKMARKAAVVLGVATIALSLLKAGYNYFSNRDKKDALQIQAALSQTTSYADYPRLVPVGQA
jgi:uncharacterized membrane protein HdeD (DUF308 family)